jgi:hypothetical protein
VHEVTVELMGDSAAWFDKEMIGHAAAAVLHYFKAESGQDAVTVAEFSAALERVLRGLGVEVKASASSSTLQLGKPAAGPAPAVPPASPGRIIDADLRALAGEADIAWELAFFPRLRDEIRRRLDGSPMVLHFQGLRPCVKHLAGAKRWSAHCQTLNDHIVDYLRTCLGAEKAGAGCALVVR